MTKEISMRVTPQMAADETLLKEQISKEQGIGCRHICAVRILKRSIDARQRQIFVNLTVRVFIDEQPPQTEYEPIIYHSVEGKPQVVVVGSGPGGLFAALRLIE